MQPARYFLDNLLVNKNKVNPNDNPNIFLDESIKEVGVTFNAFKRSIEIQSDMKDCTYKNIKLIRDTTIHPSNDNKSIALACLTFVTNDKLDNLNDFSIGPLIIRSKKLKSFPGKLSPAGGLYDENDLTCERTAFRELMEELRLNEYLDPSIINNLQQNLKLTHLIFSHPIGRFNVTLVFSVSLPEAYIDKFNCDIYQIDEVDKVINKLKGVEIIESLFNDCPFSDKGWTPNGAMIVLDYLMMVAKKHKSYSKIMVMAIDNFTKSGLCSPQKEDLKSFLVMKLTPLLYALKSEIKSEVKAEVKSEIKIETKAEIKTEVKTETKSEVKTETRTQDIFQKDIDTIRLYESGTLPERLFKASPVKLKDTGALNNLMKKRWNDGCGDEYDIESINTSTSSYNIANDIAYIVTNSNNFVIEFNFVGYRSVKDANYNCKFQIFENAIRQLEKFDVTVKKSPIMTGGNEYYDEGPSQTGIKITCSKSKL